MNWSDCLFQPELGPHWNGVRLAVSVAGPQSPERPYGLNLGLHVGDHADEVHARRQALSTWMGAPIVWLNQVHGTEVFCANQPVPMDVTPAQADACTALNSEVALAIMTADCLPAVFVARNRHGQAVGVAAAHAGWRGLQAGVLEKTVRELIGLTQTDVNLVSGWLGPCIGPSSFEVGQEVFDAFVQSHPENADFFVPVTGQNTVESPAVPSKYLANLRALADSALRRCGLSDIQQSDVDTFTDSRWFSHRRAQKQGVPAGRFATLIRLLP